ncbi:MAG: hypothetical protein H7289_15680 [Mucilaginibacter sp.]|nr:hypothetical protein [Mucilaginibacter sp.]
MIKNFCFIISFAFISFNAFSQGCSDAGFCSLGALKNVNTGNQPKHIIDFGFNFGYGEQKTLTYNPYLQYGVTLNDKWFVQGKLTSTYAKGFLGDKFDVGDIYGVVTYKPTTDENNAIHLVGGIKIPLTTSNDKNANGLPLPLDYQSSIGTYDVIGGINYLFHKHLEADLALQLPVIQNNKSTFSPTLYPGDNRINYFAPTINFERKPDVLFRLGVYINLPAAITLKPNLLAIYHLGQDTYQNPAGNRDQLIGTKGLTINEGITLTKQFKNNNRLELLTAMPIKGRQVRADGLTRKWVLNVQYSVAF